MSKINMANVYWKTDDVKEILSDLGIKPTKENIDKIVTPEFVDELRVKILDSGARFIKSRAKYKFRKRKK